MKQDFLKGKRILIAEDDYVNQKLITHSMQSTGADFTIAGNGAEAIECLLEGQYDLILMDINMPEMDGFEATEYIRKTLKLQIPIIAMTGWSSKDDNNKFERVGMNGTLPKPFGLDALYKTLGDLLGPQKNAQVAATNMPSTNASSQKVDTNISTTHTIPVSPVMATLTPTAVTNTSNSPVPSPLTEISDMPTVDLTLLNELSESDNEYKKTIINMFLETMPETIQQIEKEFAAQNWDAFSKAAHYAKSSLSVINVEKLRTLVGLMEMYAKKLENLDKLGAMLHEMKVQYAKVVIILDEELRK